MTAITLAVGCWIAAAGALSGQVVDGGGKPVAGARVFIEPGVVGALTETKTDASGAFRFEEAPAGGTGVFAIAEGYAFGGQHVDLAVGDAPGELAIRLARPTSVSGKVSDPRGNPVAGARITRIGLLGDAKVGIPLSKLSPFGFEEPVTGEDGRFTVPLVPEGASIALKFSHPLFAQEAIDSVACGEQDVRVTLVAGTLVRGTVRSRDKGLPVVSADILVRSASPPYDTAVTVTNGSGEFTLRLKPGLYLYQAAGAAYRSLGWNRLPVGTGGLEQDVSLAVAGVGSVAGKVCDAQSGQPISGVRVLVEVDGNAVDIVHTGKSGEFEAATPEGENTVRIETVPGYLRPELPGQKVQVAQSRRTEVPVFWLAPIPAYTVQVVDETMAPVPGAIIQVLRPLQFGWHIADAEGRVTIRVGGLPADGIIAGMAEHPSAAFGALFALRPQDSASAKVQLLPLGSVSGKVVTDKGKPVAGAVVGAVFAENLVEDPPWLWRSVADAAGLFSWAAVAPQMPQRCDAAAGESSGESAPFSLEPGETKDLGNIVLTKAESGPTVQGKTLDWAAYPLRSGVLPDKQRRKGKPACVMYCPASEAPMVLEGLSAVRAIVNDAVILAVVVDGTYAAPDSPIPVLSGQPPAPGTTYLTGSDGKVVLETFGLPPPHLLHALAAAAENTGDGK